MGVVYHARYLVWLDVGRTEHLRSTGVSYRDLEEMGLRLMVSEAHLRYRRSARYDDEVRIRTWIRERASRRVTFGYVVEHAVTGALLVTATTALLVLDQSFDFARLPEAVAARLVPVPDPVRL
jgi:acyl-CoA thioester hydrolase